jgi:hypothetical protein
MIMLYRKPQKNPISDPELASFITLGTAPARSRTLADHELARHAEDRVVLRGDEVLARRVAAPVDQWQQRGAREAGGVCEPGHLDDGGVDVVQRGDALDAEDLRGEVIQIRLSTQ